jgi:hypothetical protein
MPPMLPLLLAQLLIMTPFAAATTGPATDDVNQLPGSRFWDSRIHFGHDLQRYNSSGSTYHRSSQAGHYDTRVRRAET